MVSEVKRVEQCERRERCKSRAKQLNNKLAGEEADDKYVFLICINLE
jgi:hypothetical protein